MTADETDGGGLFTFLKSIWSQTRQMVGVCCATDEADGGGLFTFLKST